MTTRRAAAVGALAVVLLLAVLSATRPALPLPLTVDLRGLGTGGTGGRTLLGEVVGRVALLVPAAAAGLGLVLLGRRAGRTGLLVLDGVAAPIAVFLVAQLNGMSDAGGLVLVYAATAAAVLLRVLEERDRGGRTDEGALRLAAMLGIVPWGVVALHQVGGLVAGVPPVPGVQVLTLVVLAATVAEAAASWRGRRRSPAPSAAEAVLVVLPPVLLAALSVLAVA